MTATTIALDAMGGDHGTHVVIPAAFEVVETRPGVRMVLVGDQVAIERELAAIGATGDERLIVHHASQHVGMDESPAVALRSKKDSSMRVAIDLVKSGAADACVSAGNTGALMATARFVLRTLPGIDRPAIITALPTVTGHVHVLDLGANVDVTPEQFVQFAVMGSVLCSAVDNKPEPKIALLNIGEEAIKGNERVKEASRLIAHAGVNYVGFIEGDGIYHDDVDVVVCDGFVGNVALKTSEGVARMISHFLRAEFSSNLLTRLAGLAALPVLRTLRRRMDPRRYNGASLLGLRGIVIKSHGGADKLAFRHAIEEAITEVAKNIPKRINEQLQTRLDQRETA